jgi:hypothetical protein
LFGQKTKIRVWANTAKQPREDSEWMRSIDVATPCHLRGETQRTGTGLRVSAV